MTRYIALFASFALLVAGTAGAGTMTELDLSDCDDMGCQGTSVNLKVEDQGNGMFHVTYTLDVSEYDGNRDGFNQLAWKAIKGASEVELLSAEGGLGAWGDAVMSTVASNSTCDKTNGNTDKWCIDGYADLNGGEMVFEYKVTGGELMDVEDWSLKAQYANGPGNARGKIISASGPPEPGDAVPEPSAALLFGLGAIFVAHSTRRR